MSENTHPRGLRALFVSAAVTTALALAAVVSWDDRPVATFAFGEDRVELAPFDEVAMFDAMTLRIDMPFSGYVYVVSFDYERGAVCYYPTDFLGTDHLGADDRMNFFAAGQHELPGTWDTKAQSWYVPDSRETMSLCVVVSKRALIDLEEMLVLTRQVGNRAFSNRAMGMYMPRAGRAKVIGKKSMPHDVLRAAMNQEDSIRAGAMVPCRNHPGVFVKVLNIRISSPRPGVTPPNNPFGARLNQLTKKKLKEPKPPKKGR
jgi:hypothetical protein